jgi:hypothetical protein
MFEGQATELVLESTPAEQLFKLVELAHSVVVGPQPLPWLSQVCTLVPSAHLISFGEQALAQ